MIRMFILSLLAALFVFPCAAQQKTNSKKKAKFHVDGVCEMCKARIEKAALIKGVRVAEWNVEEKMMTVVYSTKNTDVEKIQRAIAAIGHDTELFQADSVAYSKLHHCCFYRDSENIRNKE